MIVSNTVCSNDVCSRFIEGTSKDPYVCTEDGVICTLCAEDTLEEFHHFRIARLEAWSWATTGKLPIIFR